MPQIPPSPLELRPPPPPPPPPPPLSSASLKYLILHFYAKRSSNLCLSSTNLGPSSEEETKKKIYYVINEELSYKDKAFGDRMKYWTSINEPNLFANIAYMVGQYPPAHCSISLGNCSAGNSNVEPHGYAQHVTGTCGGHQAIPRPFAGN
ncbi:hypothetical protein LguiA_003353 [Lonicera macranthoides]